MLVLFGVQPVTEREELSSYFTQEDQIVAAKNALEN